MKDIDQSRFALISALARAHEARPDEYPDREALLSMSDDALRSYAIGLLQLLGAEPRGDMMATGLQQELRMILQDAP